MRVFSKLKFYKNETKKIYFICTKGEGIFKECRLVNIETKEVSEHYFTTESVVMDYAA